MADRIVYWDACLFKYLFVEINACWDASQDNRRAGYKRDKVCRSIKNAESTTPDSLYAFVLLAGSALVDPDTGHIRLLATSPPLGFKFNPVIGNLSTSGVCCLT